MDDDLASEESQEVEEKAEAIVVTVQFFFLFVPPLLHLCLININIIWCCSLAVVQGRDTKIPFKNAGAIQHTQQ